MRSGFQITTATSRETELQTQRLVIIINQSASAIKHFAKSDRVGSHCLDMKPGPDLPYGHPGHVPRGPLASRGPPGWQKNIYNIYYFFDNLSTLLLQFSILTLVWSPEEPTILDSSG